MTSSIQSNQSQEKLKVREFLESYRGANVYHPPLVDSKGDLVGNNGDRLMVMGTERVYEDLQITKVDSPLGADLIVLGANGGMLDSFTHIPGLFRRLATQFPNQPMCVLPSTFYYKSRSLADDIGNRTAPLTIFCRELYSYSHLLNDHALPSCCSVQLDCDLAFELGGTEYLSGVASMKPKHILIVERLDGEHLSYSLGTASNRMRLRKWAGRYLSRNVKKRLYPIVRQIRARALTPFRQQCEEILQAQYPELSRLPRFVADISQVDTCTFDEFNAAIGHAAVVFTTRLHVAILAAMLGRPTFVFEGPYHKIRGIFEYSLSERAGVTLVPIRNEG